MKNEPQQFLDTVKVFLKYGIIMFFAVISSCENRDWENPFDPDCPKEIFTPSNFEAIQQDSLINLNWEQSNMNISGFVIERSTDNENWTNIATLSKTETSWNDSNTEGGTQYYYRIVAQAGGNLSNKETTQITPVFSSKIITTSIIELHPTSAILGGEITSDGGGEITARGVCWDTSANPTINDSKTEDGDGPGVFASTLTGLTNNKLYYARAYSTNSAGISYGNEISFKTYYGEITDIDGNVYPTVQIGEQIWMAENLKTTTYNDGSPIPYITENSEWSNLTSGAFCYYNNDTANAKIYGALYNWHAVNSGKLAPKGWHIPAFEEYEKLFSYLGGTEVAGGKMKEVGNLHWTSPNTGATNESGFTGLPGGFRANKGGGGRFLKLGSNGWFLKKRSTPDFFCLLNTANEIKSTNGFAYWNYFDSNTGVSIRCILGEEATTATVLTSDISDITTNSAVLGGDVTDDGGATVTENGIVYSTSQNPTTADIKVVMESITGSFSDTVTGLTPGTTYFVKAYAINSEGTSYGNEISFTTIPNNIPTVYTLIPSNIIPGAATLGGEITHEGASVIIERGVCWSTDPNPTVDDTRAFFYLFGSDGIESYSREITGFLANTTYYVRAYAKNSNGTAYGQEENWTTSTEIALPTVTTNEPEDITTSSAVLGGHVDNTGGTFVSEWGVVYGTSSNPTVEDNKFVIQDTEINGNSGSIGVTVNELNTGTNYYVRAYALNSQGTSYGEQKSFTTEQNLSLATITTSSPENVTSNSAVLGGNITSNGNSTVTERGIVYGTGQNPTINDYRIAIGYDVGSFSNLINGLNSNTTYFVRAYAINNQGIAYGNEVSFQTLESENELVTDIDGNVYETVKIGEQVWFKSNLKTTKYNDGVPISNIVDNFEWEHTSTGAYCWQNNLVDYKSLYGALYNWYAVNTDKLCPVGWHIPTDSEWSTLVNYLGGPGLAGGKLKSQSSWESPNKGATNSSGFTGLPGGQRNGNGAFGNIKIRGTFWSLSESSSGEAWLRYLSFSSPDCYRRDYYKIYGLSVRCIKD